METRVCRVLPKPTAPKLGDDQVAALIRIPVLSGTDTDPEWERGLLQALTTGAADAL